MSVWKEQQSDVKGIKKRLPHGFDFATQNLGKRSSKMKEDWKECKLGEVCDFQNGYAFKSSEFKSDGEYKVVKIKELKDGLVKFFDDSACVDSQNCSDFDKFVIEKNDVIFALTGDPVSKPNPLSWVGRVSIYRNSEKAVLNQRTCKVKKSNNFDNVFLYYYFRQWENFYGLASKATGSASQANISTNTIADTIITLPPLATQQKIAAILSSLDDKIELNNKINDNLEQQAQAIFKSWFVDFEPFGGKMPEEWRVGKVGDLGEIICGKTPSTKIKEYYGNECPFITIPDMHNNVYACFTERYLSKLGMESQIGKSLPVNSVCVSCIATPGLVILTDKISQTNQQINSIIPNKNMSSYYVYLLMQSLAETIKMLGSSGSTTSNLNKDQFSKIDVLIPAIYELKIFNSIVEPLFQNIRNNIHENQKLTALRDTLLAKLMSGEIDVESVKI